MEKKAQRIQSQGVTLVVTSCWCSISFAPPESLLVEAHRTQHDPEAADVDLYCPMGHKIIFPDDYDVDKHG